VEELFQCGDPLIMPSPLDSGLLDAPAGRSGEHSHKSFSIILKEQLIIRICCTFVSGGTFTSSHAQSGWRRP
jgi:hypothetical protein